MRIEENLSIYRAGRGVCLVFRAVWDGSLFFCEEQEDPSRGHGRSQKFTIGFVFSVCSAAEELFYEESPDRRSPSTPPILVGGAAQPWLEEQPWPPAEVPRRSADTYHSISTQNSTSREISLGVRIGGHHLPRRRPRLEEGTPRPLRVPTLFCLLLTF